MKLTAFGQSLLDSAAPEFALYDYATGAFLREATPEENAASEEAAIHDGGRGVILIDDIEAYVV